MTTTENPFHLGAHEGTGPAFQDPVEDMAEQQGPSLLERISTGLRVMLDLQVELGEHLEKQAAAHRDLLAKLDARTPVDYGISASATYPSSGVLCLNLGTPDRGTYWEVQSVSVGGLDQNITAAGSAGLYVNPLGLQTGGITAGQSPGLTSMVDQATTLPNVGFYGGRQCYVGDGEYLFLVVFGGTASQIYQANAQVAVYNVAAAGGRVTAYT